MAEVVEKKKNFEYYLDLLPEIRTVVIDQMEPEDRCRFTRSSKLCCKEVKASKKYLYELELCVFNENESMLTVVHGAYEHYSQRQIGYKLKFENTPRDGCIIECKKMIGGLLWKIDMPSSININELALKHFKNFLKFYQRNIKVLVIDDPGFRLDLSNFDFEVDCLRNLEKLRILYNYDSNELLSKTKKPLKCLASYMEHNAGFLEKFPMIYEIQEGLFVRELRLTKDQFLRLSALRVSIHIGELTEMDIYNFIRSWQKGTIGKELKYYDWNINKSNFNYKKFKNLFEESRSSDTYYFDIKHHKDPRKKGRIAKCTCRTYLDYVYPTISFREINET